jgi:1,4-dihydroxy-2-naphthoate octaprenyltransferase
VPASVWALSCLVGATTSIILFTSHFHQIEGDKKAGKMSPLVRLGPALGFKVLQGSVAAVYGGLAVAAAAGLLPVHCVLVAVASLPAAREMLAFAAAHHLDPSRIPPLKRIACHWHIAFGCSLALGLLAARLVRLPL